MLGLAGVMEDRTNPRCVMGLVARCHREPMQGEKYEYDNGLTIAIKCLVKIKG